MKQEQNFELGDIVYYYISNQDYGKALICGIQQNTIVPTAGDYFFNVPKKEYYIAWYGIDNFLKTKVLDGPVEKYMLVDRCFTRLFDNSADFKEYVGKALQSRIITLEKELEERKEEMNDEISGLEEGLDKKRHALSLFREDVTLK